MEKPCRENSWKSKKKTKSPEKAGRKQMLNATYKAYIKSIQQYGCEVLITATPTTLNKLEVIQNQPLRFITGAVKSTPLPSFQVLTMNRPLKIERKKWH